MTTTTGRSGDTGAAPQAPGQSPNPTEQVRGVAETSKEEVASVATDATEHVRDLVGRSRAELKDRADEQARDLASTLSGLGRELTDVAQGNAAPQGMVADVAAELGAKASRLGEQLQERGLDGVLRDVKDFSRRRPGAFVVGAMGLGLLCGRVLRNADTEALKQAAKPAPEEPPQPASPSGDGTQGEQIDLTGLGV